MSGLSYIPKIVYNSITMNFTYPPEHDDGEQRSSDISSSTALAGDLQTIYNHTEITRLIKFSLLTPTQFAAVQTFFDSWANKGKSFDYYESDNDSAFVTYSLEPGSYDFSPIRQTYKGLVTGFLYQVEMTFRRSVST